MNLKLDTSTVDVNEPITSIPKTHQGYCYFIVQDELNIAVRPSLPFWINEISTNYYGLSNSVIGSATALASRYFEKPLISDLSSESIYDYLNTFMWQRIPTQTLTELFYHSTISATFPVDAVPMPSVDDPVKLELLDLFNSFDDEDLDTDIAYHLTNALNNVIKDNGKQVIRIIAKLINQHEINDNMIYETLRAIGRIEDENTKIDRFEILLGSLRDQVAIIRDGAISGLSFLDDKKALPQLRILLEKETVPTLKENIKVAMKDLESG